VSIGKRYTQLPDGLPGRITEYAATLTGDDDTPFETANRIDKQLSAENTYTVNTTHEPGADPVDQFLFEMEGGDAQYFASAMVVLLRTQGIPARYVTGYSVGEPAGEEKYVVRNVNAHAWVEVYFSGHGWIAFDPTPVDERLDAENAAVGQDDAMAHVLLVNENVSTVPIDSSNILTGTGADGESPPTTEDNSTRSEDGSRSDSTNTTDETAPSESTDSSGDRSETSNNQSTSNDGSIAASLAPESPQPGDSVTVTVTRDGDSVSGVIVLFNGNEVGQTNATGQVRGTVPYVRTFEVAVVTDPQSSIVSTTASFRDTSVGQTVDSRQYNIYSAEIPPASETDKNSPEETLNVDGGADENRLQLTQFERDTHALTLKRADRRHRQQRPSTATDRHNRSTTVLSVTLDTVATVDVNPTPLVSGGDLTVRMLVNGRSVSDATVRVAGQVVGETNETGYLTATVPENSTGSDIPVRVQRGEIQASKAVVAGPLQLTLRPERTPVLPGHALTITTTVNSVPVTGVPVRQDGRLAGSSDMNGTINTTLPFARSSTITVAYPGGETTREIGGMAQNVILLASGGVIAVLLAGTGLRYFRRSETGEPRRPSIFRRLFTIGRGAGAWVIRRLFTIQAGAAELEARLRAGITTWPALILGLWRSRPTPLWQPLVAAVSLLVALVRSRGKPAASAVTDDGQPDTTTNEQLTGSDVSVQQAWGSFVRLVVRQVDTTATPVELAERGIEAGLPREPIERLTESFRAVEYGRENPDSQAETANAALADIEAGREAETSERQTRSENE
jgi:Transglutaminase-like enzymes, putative cysteine proteases